MKTKRQALKQEIFLLTIALIFIMATGWKAKAAAAESYGDLSSYSFDIADLRNPENAHTFNGADGKPGIIVYGGIEDCYYTRDVLQSLDYLTKFLDMDQISIYIFDIKGFSAEEIVNKLDSFGISDKICVNSASSVIGPNSSQCDEMFVYCWKQLTGSQGFIMPLVVYKDAEGKIVNYTTGSSGVQEIVSNIETLGVKCEYSNTLSKYFITGSDDYDAAYEVLDIMNQERIKDGKTPLTMDENLLGCAMTRAAETVFYFSHTRPNGTSCSTITPYLMGENIACGQATPQSVMDSWMNSEGHRRNILSENYTTVGIGCFYHNGTYYWTQLFGNSTAKNVEKPENTEMTHLISASASLAGQKIFAETTSLTQNDVLQLKLQAGAAYLTLQPSCTDWFSSNESVASVDSVGKVRAKSEGSTVITATNKWDSSNTTQITITVSASNGATDDTDMPGDADDTTDDTETPGNTGITDVPQGSNFASYEGYEFYKDEDGSITCYSSSGAKVINEFKCDGTYTYYFQADGTAMKDRLSYHPDGMHVIYFDKNGHEVFDSFAWVGYNIPSMETGIATELNEYCYFGSLGYQYTDVLTYGNKETGTEEELLYANQYGILERKGWFQFSETVTTPWGSNQAIAGGYGCANADGTLLINTWTNDWQGRQCYLQGNGVALYP